MKKTLLFLLTLHIFSPCKLFAATGFSESEVGSLNSSNLVAHWKLNGNTNDASGNGYNGSNHGVTFETLSSGETVGVFDGSSYISTSFYPMYELNDNLTISLWFKITANTASSNLYLVGLERSNHQELAITYSSNNRRLRGAFRDDSWNQSSPLSSSDPNDGRWHHAVLTRDTNTDKVAIYIDGSKTGEVTDVTTDALNKINSRWLALGADNNSSHGIVYRFNGNIDDIRFYNYALSSSEINQLYRNGDYPNDDPTSSITITSNSKFNHQNWLTVDGTLMGGTKEFDWQTGSQHTIEAGANLWNTATQDWERDDFREWSHGPTDWSINYTVPQSRERLTAYYDAFRKIKVSMNSSEGDIGINKASMQNNEIWLLDSKTAQIEAIPQQGYIFTEWRSYSLNDALATGTYSIIGTDNPISLQGPQNIRAIFTAPEDPQLFITSITPSQKQVLDWGETAEYLVEVKDNQNQPVKSARIFVRDRARDFVGYYASWTAGNGQVKYKTTIPDGQPNGTNYEIGFRAHKSGYQVSDKQVVTVEIFHENKSITLVSPNGGETYNISDPIEITWNAQGISQVKIEYSSNNGGSWQEIPSSIPAASGSFNWTNHDIPSEEYLVKISDAADGAIYDVCDSVFSIKSKTINLISPKAGEKYAVSEPIPIKWESQGITQVKIEYSSDDGISWQIIPSSIPAVNKEFNWSPDTPSEKYRIRISDVSNANYSAENDSTFGVYSYGTTVIVHGWQINDKSDIDWAYEMAKAIAVRKGGGTIWQIVQEKEPTLWQSPIGNGRENIIILDWTIESNSFTFGFAEAAADAFFARLISGMKDNKWKLDKIHFIGHSRGTVVSSEIIQRLGAFSDLGDFTCDWNIHFTFLDAHPSDWIYDDDDVNSDNIDDGVVCWENVGYADNYFELFFTNNFWGRPTIKGINKKYNHNLTFQIPGVIFFAHSFVHTWYHGTINLDAEDDGSSRILPTFYLLNKRETSGFNYSLDFPPKINTIQSERIHIWADHTFSDKSIFNGSFEFGNGPQIPGWQFEGGSVGSAEVENNTISLNYNSTDHNWFYIPKNSNTVYISAYAYPSSPAPSDQGSIKIGNESFSIEIGDSFNGTYKSDYFLTQTYSDIFPITIPQELKGTTQRLRISHNISTINQGFLYVDYVGYEKPDKTKIASLFTPNINQNQKSHSNQIQNSSVPYLHIYTPDGLHTGPTSDSTFVTEIPGTSYSFKPENGFAEIKFNPDGVQDYIISVDANGADGKIDVRYYDWGRPGTVNGQVDDIPLSPTSTVLCTLKTVNPNLHFYAYQNGSSDPDSIYSPGHHFQKYVVIANAGEHGMISPLDTSLVVYGDTLRYSITPDKGFKVDKLFIDNVEVDPQNEYTFAAISQDHTISVEFTNDVNTAIETNNTPGQFLLEQNYPNPFNPSTTIHYTLPRPSHVQIIVFNINGHLVKTLVNTTQQGGEFSIEWDGKDGSGIIQPSGIYLLKMQAGDQIFTRKMTLMR